MERSYRARFLDTCAQTSAGVVEADVKCWIYDDGQVYWELRRLLKHKSENAGGKLLVHRELTQYKSLWITEFQHCGVEGHAIHDSLNAARSSGNVEALADPMTREEYSISTAGLLCLMWFWHRCSRTMAGGQGLFSKAS